jgi:hypothetical protein
MATFRDAILPALDQLRALPGVFGIRRFTVTARSRVWTGARPGLGTKTDTDILITNALQTPQGTTQEPVRVRYLTTREVIASGGLYRDRDLRVGPLTPSWLATLIFPAGGYADAQVDPLTSASPTEIFWKVTGPSLPSAGAWCDVIRLEETALHFSVVLRTTGKTP